MRLLVKIYNYAFLTILIGGTVLGFAIAASWYLVGPVLFPWP